MRRAVKKRMAHFVYDHAALLSSWLRRRAWFAGLGGRLALTDVFTGGGRPWMGKLTSCAESTALDEM